jgi:HK97 family phage major capsid protein
MDDLKKQVEDGFAEVKTGFEAFKEANDARLAEIEAKGAADPVTVDKLDKIEKSLAGYEDLNQQLVKAQETQKNTDEQIAATTKAIEALEVAIKRHKPADADEEVSQYSKDFGLYLRSASDDDFAPETMQALKAVQADLKTKGLITTDDTTGGYYVAPPEVEAGILKTVVETSPIRSICRVTKIGTRELKLPKRTAEFAAVRVSEVGTRAETTGYTTGEVTIDAPEMYADFRISNAMLEDSAYNLEAEAGLEFAEQFALKEGTESITGASVDTMEGMTINATIIAAYVASGGASTITADGVINLYHDLKTVYAKAAVWILNRTTLGVVRKLKDGAGRYLWEPGLAAGIPSSLQGRPYVEFPDMPDVSAGTYPIGFGDFMKGYRMVDRVNMSILRDPFTVASTGQIKFLARRRVGGKVIQAEAIKLMKVAAS